MGKDFNRNIWAICVIVLGIILFLKYIGFCNFNIIFNGWWTLFFIIPAIINLCQKNSLSEKLTSGTVLLSALLVLCGEQHLFPDSVNVWMAVGALIIVRVGIGMAMKDEDDKINVTTSKNKDDVIEVTKTETKSNEDNNENKEDK